MKVKDLIEQLKACDQEKFVFVFVDADIFIANSVDEMSDRVDINTNFKKEK
jgi:prefoldin subunit 5